jgi:hypothetical protein
MNKKLLFLFVLVCAAANAQQLIKSPQDINKSVISSTAGKNYSLSFPGTGYVQLPNQLFNNPNEFTIEAWVNTSEESSQYGMVFYHGQGGQIQFIVRDDFTVELDIMLANGTWYGVVSHDKLIQSQWNHIAGIYTRTENELKIFINGIIDSTFSVPNLDLYSPTGFVCRIGTYGGSSLLRTYIGLINEVRLSNIARYSNNFTPTTDWINDTNTVGLWEFNEGAGIITYDGSSNGFNGNIVGLQWSTDVPNNIQVVPAVSTLSATNVSSSSSTLNGSITPEGANTTAQFDYGITTSYGSTAIVEQSSITSSSNVNVSANISGLTPNTLYHFRCEATDSSGTTYGGDSTFNTLFTGEYQPDTNTVLLLHLNDQGSSIKDFSTNNNNGTAYGTSIVEGKFGLARNFNGISDWIQIPNSASLQITNAITVEAWINITQNETDWHSFVSKMSEGYGIVHGYDLRIVGMEPIFTLVSPAGNFNNFAATQYQLPINQWFHFAGTYDGSQLKIYLDGAIIFDSSFTGQIAVGTEDLFIGKQNVTSNNRYTSAIIDEVRISNIARPPNEFDLQLPPKNLSAIISGKTINLDWQNGGGAVGLLRYKIYRGLDSVNVSVIDSSIFNKYNDSNIVSSTKYYYRISAVDSTGFEGAMSNTINITASSNTPATVQQVSPFNGSWGNIQPVQLKWMSCAGAKNYRLQFGTDSTFATIMIDTTGLTDTSFTVSSLSNHSTYYWRVNAINAGGTNNWSSVWNLTVVKRGDVDENVSGGPDAYSASLVLKDLANLDTLNPQQLAVAEVDGNLGIDANDAYYILYATVYGIFPDSSLPKVASGQAGSIAVGQLSSLVNSNLITIPILLQKSKGIHACFIELNIDSRYADVDSVTFILPQGWLMVHNYVNGVLKIAMAGITTLPDGTIAEIRLKLKDNNTKLNISGSAILNTNLSSQIGSFIIQSVPNQFELSQNYPNPFNPSSVINYALPISSNVKIEIYNILGERVRELLNAQENAGYYSINFNTVGLASGVYLYMIEAKSLDGKSEYRDAKKMLLLK